MIPPGQACRRRPKLRFGPSGIHFFDRVSGLNFLVDELIPAEAEWAIAPRQVSIALTNACDLQCPYCFAPKTPAALKFERVVSWLTELDANGGLGVGFGGGEPTLYPQFADLCAHVARTTNLAVTFTTHGHHLTDKLLNSLRGNIHFVRVSMDGMGATYERLRNRPFEALRKQLERIRNIVRFGINYVVNADTFGDIDAAAEFAEWIGASELLILPEHPVNERPGLPDETAAALRAWVLNYGGGVRLAISETGSEGMPTCDPLSREIGLRAYAHIDAKGVLKRTSFDHEGVAIGEQGVLFALRKLQQTTGLAI